MPCQFIRQIEQIKRQVLLSDHAIADSTTLRWQGHSTWHQAMGSPREFHAHALFELEDVLSMYQLGIRMREEKNMPQIMPIEAYNK